MKITQYGKVIVGFPTLVNFVNVTNITNGTFLIEKMLKPALGVEIKTAFDQPVAFTWNCTNYTSNTLQL